MSHELTAELLKRAKDPRRPVPGVTFAGDRHVRHEGRLPQVDFNQVTRDIDRANGWAGSQPYYNAGAELMPTS